MPESLLDKIIRKSPTLETLTIKLPANLIETRAQFLKEHGLTDEEAARLDEEAYRRIFDALGRVHKPKKARAPRTKADTAKAR